MRKVPADAVFLHRGVVGVVGFDPHRDTMLPERTSMICDKLPRTESVGIKPNFFFGALVILPE
jgi:hypothetical protein